MRLTRFICLGALACSVAVAEPAMAQVQPAGTGEPAYTNSTQNTQWFEWPASSGIDKYRIRFDYYANNASVANPTYGMTNGGSAWANWSGVANLQHGGQYGICAQGQYTFPNDSLWISDGPNSCSMGTMLGRRAYTTIDRSKPTAAMQLAGGAAYTRNASIPLRVAFSDDVAGPFPANFICFQYGGGPTGICDAGAGFIYGYNAACSVPAGGGKSTNFDCVADYGTSTPDGPVWACVRAADASIPDNPSSSNQSASADKANLSDPSCDGVVLDRTAPQVSVAAASTARVGDLVDFGVQASDATSGLTEQYEWTWGDNTAAGSGDTARHTFTQAGTYEVRVKTADAAGNAATATKVITVTATQTGGGGGTPGGGGGGETPGGGGGGDETPGGGGVTPGGGGSTPDDGGSTSQDDGGSDDAGDDSADEAEAPEFSLSSPRKLKLGRAKAIRIAIAAGAPGRVSVALVRSGRVHARGAKAVGAGTSSYALKLPKRLKAGKYSLRATYTPDGGSAETKKRSLKLTGKAKARRARASSLRPAARLSGAPRALPDGRFHGRRPARTFAADALAG